MASMQSHFCFLLKHAKDNQDHTVCAVVQSRFRHPPGPSPHLEPVYHTSFLSPAPAQPPLRHSLTRVVCVPMGPLPEDSVTIRAGRGWEGPARIHMRTQPRAGCTSPKHRVYRSEKFRGGIPSFTGAASPSIPTMQHHPFFIRNVHSASRSVHHILQRRLGRPKTVLKNNTLQPQTSSEHGEFRVPLPLRH